MTTIRDTTRPRVWSTDEAWQRKLARDASNVERLLPQHLGDLHRDVFARAEQCGADSVVLSGSTARGARTRISDLDYHVVGEAFDTRGLSGEADVHVLSRSDVFDRLTTGDDFVHWSIRFGLVVSGGSTVRDALRMIDERALWPDPDRKRSQATRSIELASRVVASGDVEGGLEHVRIALSLAARSFLLRHSVFPLSRAELPDQLRLAGSAIAAEYLAASIDEALGPESLDPALGAAHDLVKTSTG